MTRNDPSLNRDKWLADFADQALDGKVDNLSTIGSDPEMRSLADTLLRLKNAFPTEKLESASVKRMQARILERWRREEQKKTRWFKFFQFGWLTQSQRQQFGMAFAVIAIVAILLLATPTLFFGSEITGSGGFGLPPNAFLWIALGALIVAIVWLLRRKP